MHMLSRRLGILSVCLMLLALGLPAVAQNRIVEGVVTDNQGKPIKDAQVVIQSLESSVRSYKVKTDKNGKYIYLGIAQGQYRVVVRAKGFSPNYVQPIRPTIQEPTKVDIQLTPGEDQKLPFEFTEEELEQYRKEMEKAEQRKAVSAEVQAAFNAGLELANAGKYEEAIVEYQKALEKDPEQANILGNMADAYAKLEKNEEALAYYQKAIKASPDEAAFYTNIGVLLSRMGKNKESQEAFKKAAELNPAGSAQNFYNIGATMVNSGQTDAAIAAFKQAIAADPNFAEAYYQLGMCLSGSPDTMADAVKALEKYIEIGNKPDQIDVAKQIIAALKAAQ